MLTSLFFTLAGLIGSLGGVWVLALFVPTVAAVVKSTLDFARSPIGIALAGVALVLFLFSSGYISGDLHGTAKTKAAWRADVDATARAAIARESALREEMKKMADAATATDDSFGKSLDQQVQKNAAENPDPLACRRATRDDIRRLLSIH